MGFEISNLEAGQQPAAQSLSVVLASDQPNVVVQESTTKNTSTFYENEQAISSKTETDIANTTYTVGAGKKFVLMALMASYDTASLIHIRLKKQTGGVGSFVTIVKMTLLTSSQGDGYGSYDLGNGLNIGNAGDVFKMTVEASVIKGNIWAAFGGSEV